MDVKKMDIETLKKIGGREWTKNGMHRIYFNDLPALYGLKCEYYNTGNIRKATLDGEYISNSGARRLSTTLDLGKLWYDVPTGKYMATHLSEETVAVLVAAIQKLADEGKNPSIVEM